MSNVPLPDRLVPTREVAAMFGLSAPGLLAAVRAGRFPKPIKVSRTRCVWPKNVVDAEMAKLKAQVEGSTDAA